MTLNQLSTQNTNHTLDYSTVRQAIGQHYNKATRLVKKVVKLAILEYESSIVEKSKSNPKILYTYINQNKKCNDSIRALRDSSGELTSYKSVIANLLNYQFFSAFSSPDMLSTYSYSPTYSTAESNIFLLNNNIFIPENVDKIFDKLDKRKPPGSDGFYPYVLVECHNTQFLLPRSLSNHTPLGKHLYTGKKLV